MNATSACHLAYYSIIIFQLDPESFSNAKSGMEKQEVAQRLRRTTERNSSEETSDLAKDRVSRALNGVSPRAQLRLCKVNAVSVELSVRLALRLAAEEEPGGFMHSILRTEAAA